MAASEAHKITGELLSFEEGWPILQEGVNKLLQNLEGSPAHTHQFIPEEYMKLYSTVYNICQPHPLSGESQKLYDQYKKIFQDYITSKVLPSLWGKKDENLLQELAKCWNTHKYMTRWLSRFFKYLDRYFVTLKKLPTLEAVSHLTFYELVYSELNPQIRDVVISMIDRERRGEKIDQVLVKNVVDIYLEMGNDSTKYNEDFVEALIRNTTAFYSERASGWIKNESYQDYMLKVDESLNQERDRVSCYLHNRSQGKLVEALQYELLTVHEAKVEEKKDLDKEAA